MTYYAVLAVLLGWQVIQTLFQASVLVTTGVKVRQLQYDKEQLAEAKFTLNQDISRAVRLSDLETQAVAYSFEPINNQVVINPVTTVALR